MKKLFALCLLPLCLLLCACEADAPQQEEAPAELQIGCSQLGSESSWRIGNTLSIQKAAPMVKMAACRTRRNLRAP